jgi:hypothetical protein
VAQVLGQRPLICEQRQRIDRRGGERAERFADLPQGLERQGLHDRLRDTRVDDTAPAPDLFDEQLCDLGIELGACSRDELDARRFWRALHLVRAVGGYGAVCLQHSECACRLRDVRSGESGRIAGAVESLMVVQDGCRHIAQRPDLADDIEAEPWVQLDDRAFVWSEGSRQREQSLGQREVAHVPQ